MIDFHSHVLPGIDDGAGSVRTSIEMLRASHNMGVDTIVSTSHCYPTDKNAVLDFLSERERAYGILKTETAAEKEKFPRLVSASEVHLCRGTSSIREIEELCIDKTEYMLVEMPYSDWQDDDYEELYGLIRRGIKPIMAHLDRYLERTEGVKEILSLNVLCQINADAFLNKSLRKKLLYLFTHDAAHVIGSDMHNMTSRPPNIAFAAEVIDQKFGKSYSDFILHNAERILANRTVDSARLPEPGFLKKIFL